MFQKAYESAWHHPGVAWAAALLLLVLVVARRPKLSVFLGAFSVEIALDAYFSAPFAPKVPAAIGTALSIAFVILGDYRYFVVVEGALGESFGRARAWLVALPYAFIVPIASTVVRQTAGFSDERKTFLVYEVMFFVLALVMRFAVLPKRLAVAEPEIRAWIERVTHFEIVQYALWATADVLILSGVGEPGFLLRIVPNVFYYGVFLFFVWRTAPDAMK